jgi:TonB family protein
MKFCPTCQKKYDEDIMQFCIKDGTPLIEEKQPTFTEMPSQSSVDVDEIGEETVIVRKPKNDTTQTIETKTAQKVNSGERMVISTQPEVKQKTYSTPPPTRKTNIANTIFITVFGTLGLVGGAFGAWWFLLAKPAPINNTNANVPLNLNTTANVNTANYNSNLNANISNVVYNGNTNTISNANTNSNLITNTNANFKAPTPTPTPKPTPKPTVKPANVNTDANANVKSNANTVVNTASNTVVNIKPTNTLPPPTPKSAQTPTPAAPPKPTPKNVNVGNMTGRAVSLPKPAYPQTAKQMGANGQVVVQVTVDEEGNVLSASAVSGHPLLRRPAEAAARQARFSSKIGGENAKAIGVVVYNFQN